MAKKMIEQVGRRVRGREGGKEGQSEREGGRSKEGEGKTERRERG